MFPITRGGPTVIRSLPPNQEGGLARSSMDVTPPVQASRFVTCTKK